MSIEWKLVFNCFIGVLAILNPLGNAAIFLEHVANEPVKVQRAAAFFMGAAIFIIMLVFFLFGTRILGVFGITIPAFRIAGGVLILLVGIRMMQGMSKFSNEGLEAATKGRNYIEAARNKVVRMIVPLAMPLFVGPGTITTVILYADRANNLTSVILVVVLLVCAFLASVALFFSSFLQKLLGKNGMQIVVRFMGLILCSIAIQFMIDGVAQLLPGVLNPEFLHITK